MHVEEDFVMQCLISQFVSLRVGFGGELEELEFGNLYLDLSGCSCFGLRHGGM